MKIFYDMELRKKLIAGADKLADTAKVTLGPKGRNIATYRKQNIRGAELSDRAGKGAGVFVTNDGASIIKSIILPDPTENMGAQLLGIAATKTNETAGDGSTTSMVIAQELMREAHRNISGGSVPRDYIKGIKEAVNIAIEDLKKKTINVSSMEDMVNMATNSCRDEEVGRLIGKALFKLGEDGVINIVESLGYESKLELSEGIVYDRGFISPLMAQNETQTVAELHEPYILFTDRKITNPQDILPFLIIAAEDERHCLIVCEGLEGEALTVILRNRLEGDMKVVCTPAPLYGEGKRWSMEDMAIQTGGVFMTDELGLDIRKVTREDLGTANYVKVTRNQTVITGPGGDMDAVEMRKNEIRNLIKNSDYEFNSERYKERLARLGSGVAKISIGGTSKIEIDELKLRAEDAVNAAKAGISEGVVPGGGIALYNTAEVIKNHARTLKGDEKAGALSLAKAIKAPFRQILQNAGEEVETVLGNMADEAIGVGYDVMSKDYKDMVAAGITDPLKVVRFALINAASVCEIMLTAEAGVVNADAKL